MRDIDRSTRMTICGVTSNAQCDLTKSLPETLVEILLNALETTPAPISQRRQKKRLINPITSPDWSSTFPTMMATGQEDVRSDESLLRSHLEGDVDAFPALLQRYRNELHGFLARFLGSPTAAEDVFQDTFLQIHISGATFDQTRNFKPWLYTIAANKARDFHRKRKRRTMASLDAPIGRNIDGANLLDMLESDQAKPDQPSEIADQQALVKRVLDGLPDHHREVILLGYFQRMSYQQVADVLGIPLGTVKSRLHAAVALFSTRWRKANKDHTGEGENE